MTFGENKAHLIHSLCALAIGGLSGGYSAQTFAQAPPIASGGVAIYGFLVPTADYARISGGSSGSSVSGSPVPGSGYASGDGGVTRMQSSISYWGLRGTEDLGGGNRALFQLESGIQVNNGTFTSANRMFGRNTFVGLQNNDLGTVRLGVYDTPWYRAQFGVSSPLRNPFAGDLSDIYGYAGFGGVLTATSSGTTGTSIDALFMRRVGNSINYESPDWGGLVANLQYSLSQGSQTQSNGATTQPTVYSASLAYTSGPLRAVYAYVLNRDYFGIAWLGTNQGANPAIASSGARHSVDQSHIFTIRYQLTPAWSASAVVSHFNYAASGLADASMDHFQKTAGSLTVTYHTGRGWLFAGAALASSGTCSRANGSECNTSGLGAKMWNAGYRYDVSKRTDVFLAVYQVINGRNAQYGAFPAFSSTTAPGVRQLGVSAGIETSF